MESSKIYLSPLPSPTVSSEVFATPNQYIPGEQDFKTANLYYKTLTLDTLTYNYAINNSTGFYELGSLAETSSPSLVVNSQPMPDVTYPVDYNHPANVTNLHLT